MRDADQLDRGDETMICHLFSLTSAVSLLAAVWVAYYSATLPDTFPTVWHTIYHDVDHGSGIALVGIHVVFIQRYSVVFDLTLDWVAVGLCAPAVLWAGLAWQRKHRRRKLLGAAICTTCGYDLRASQDRCPECGTPITSNTEAGA
ncbi:MAG TPA: hypothetical protein VGI81_16090 [Tepidisphaeraceae bacterium]|jgi:hypothetical protein